MQFEFAGTDQTTVTTGQAHGLAASGIDQAHDVLLHFAGQHPLHHFHGFFVGDAHALNELALFANLVQRRVDLRATAVDHHGIEAHQLEQHHVLRKVRLQFRIGHGIAAVLDHDGFAVKLADVGQRLGQDLGLLTRSNVVYRGGRVRGSSHDGNRGSAKGQSCYFKWQLA